MRIPNKFNGYSADNRRLYNDPLTAAAALADTSVAVPAALGTVEGTLGAGELISPVVTQAATGLGSFEIGRAHV